MKVVHTDAAVNYDCTKALLFWDGEFRTAGPILKKLD